MDMDTLALSQAAPGEEQKNHEETAQAVVVDAPPAVREKGLLARLQPADWVVLIGLLALFGPTFYEMYKLWTEPEAPQSYGLLVLPAALMLAWMLRARVKNMLPHPNAGGLVVAVFGILAVCAGTVLNALTFSGMGVALTITGVVLARYGTAITKKFWFPLAFLLAQVPLPHELLNVITFPLQQISVKWASFMLRIMGDVTTQGTRIHLTNYTLDVIAPCSGLTIVLPLCILSFYYLYMVAAPVWKKSILIALTLPVAMVVNAVRVALIGVVGEIFGSKAANTFHDYSGLITVVIGFAVLIFVAQEMKCHRISEEITL